MHYSNEAIAEMQSIRKNGDAYIIHPLSMACFAIGLGLTDDNLIAVILLHDICEDKIETTINHHSKRITTSTNDTSV